MCGNIFENFTLNNNVNIVINTLHYTTGQGTIYMHTKTNIISPFINVGKIIV